MRSTLDIATVVLFSGQHTKHRPTGRCAAVLVCLLLATAWAAHAQVGGIRGTVYDKDFEVPVPNAEISILEADLSSRTNEEGAYFFPDIPGGSYTLVFAKSGFTRKVIGEVAVSPGRVTEIDAWLSGDFTDMNEFIVQDFTIGGGTEIGLLNLRMEIPALMDSVSAELISQAGASDAVGALRLVAGATVQDGKYAVVRGLPDRYVNSQINGVRLPTADADKRAVQLDQFPSALIESIQVSKTFMPDQQGDASGGAVNVILKSVPDERVLSVKFGISTDDNVTGGDRFLSYRGGGVNASGLAGSERDLPIGVEEAFKDPPANRWGQDPTPKQLEEYRLREQQSEAFQPTMSTNQDSANPDLNGTITLGNRWEKGNVRFGALGNFYYKNEYGHFEEGIRDKLNGNAAENQYEAFVINEDRSELYDVIESTQSVAWGGLLSLGAQIENHELNLTAMHTRNTQDLARRMDDTRSKKIEESRPFLRNETLRYRERSTTTIQLNGNHTLPIPEWGFEDRFEFLQPEIDWTYAHNEATLWEPDFRGMQARWDPVDPDDLQGDGTWRQVAVTGNFVGRRVWRDIKESGDQIKIDGKWPFRQWTDTEGYLKAGRFQDSVSRTYEQDSFNYQYGFADGFPLPFNKLSGTFRDSSFSTLFANDEAIGYNGDPDVLPWQILKSNEDADYDGEQKIQAWYWMADIPLNKKLKITGGTRYETTEMETSFKASDGENLHFFQWKGSNLVGENFQSEDWHKADTEIEQTDLLPAVSMEFEPREGVKLRGSYSETVARPTFKEISPVLQIDTFGGDQFVGNNNLTMSALKNYDLRVEYFPSEATFLSASYFYKTIEDPIEYATVSFVENRYIQPFNFPDGIIEGYEVELRQQAGRFFPQLEGLTLRVNATIINSEVTVPAILPDTNRGLAGNTIGGDKTFADKRDMRGAPDYLFNLGLMYDWESAGTQINIFYTHKGDTLIAGEGMDNGEYIPNIYAKNFGSLTIGISKKLSEKWTISARVKNALNPDIQTVYRSEQIGGEALRTSYSTGRSFSLSLSGKF